MKGFTPTAESHGFRPDLCGRDYGRDVVKSVNISLRCDLYTFSLSYYSWIIETPVRISPSCAYRLQNFWIPLFIGQEKSSWGFD